MSPLTMLAGFAIGLTLLVLGVLGGIGIVVLKLRRETRGWSRELLTPPRREAFKGGRR